MSQQRRCIKSSNSKRSRDNYGGPQRLHGERELPGQALKEEYHFDKHRWAKRTAQRSTQECSKGNKMKTKE